MAKLKVIPGGKAAAQRFAVLVQPHYDVLYRVAYRFTRSAHDAEDLVQEVCIRAFPRLAELEQLEQPRGWLLRVLYRLFVDLSRRYERRHGASLDALDDPQLAADDPDPLEQTEADQNAERLRRAWRRLDEEQRMLLALHDIEGYSLRELNELTGLKEGTLKSRLHRARVRLGAFLERETTVRVLKARTGGTR
ncbi:MAG TPA: RNA polymerase sigma factor [Gammaproteobacteria bacterium]